MPSSDPSASEEPSLNEPASKETASTEATTGPLSALLREVPALTEPGGSRSPGAHLSESDTLEENLFADEIPEEERPSGRVGVTPQAPAALERLRRGIGHRASWSEVYRRALSFYLRAALFKGARQRQEESSSEENRPQEHSSGQNSSEARNSSGTARTGFQAGWPSGWPPAPKKKLNAPLVRALVVAGQPATLEKAPSPQEANT